MWVRVIRAFRLNGEVRVPGGDPIELPDDVARSLIAYNKAERAEATTPPVSGPMTTDSAPALVNKPADKSAEKPKPKGKGA